MYYILHRLYHEIQKQNSSFNFVTDFTFAQFIHTNATLNVSVSVRMNCSPLPSHKLSITGVAVGNYWRSSVGY